MYVNKILDRNGDLSKLNLNRTYHRGFPESMQRIGWRKHKQMSG